MVVTLNHKRMHDLQQRSDAQSAQQDGFDTPASHHCAALSKTYQQILGHKQGQIKHVSYSARHYSTAQQMDCMPGAP